MSKELEIMEKGDIINIAEKHRKKKKMEGYLDYVTQLLDFQEELEQYETSVQDVENKIKELLKKIKEGNITKKELETNFITFIKSYDVKEWSEVINRLDKNV